LEPRSHALSGAHAGETGDLGAGGRGPLEEKLRTLLQVIERSPVSVVITDAQGRIEYVNPRFSEATGYSLADVRGENPYTQASDSESDTTRTELRRALRDGREWRGEILSHRPDGQAVRELGSFSPVRDAAGRITHFVGLLEDVTERRRSEQALAATQQQLLHSQKMEAVGRLAGGVAHDFNNLLNVIVGYAELLGRTLPRGDTRRARIDQILQAAMRAGTLTRRLLAFSRNQVLQPRVIDPNAAVAETEQMLRRLIGEDVDLVLRLGHGLGSVRVDPGQLEHVLLNLAVNARDAMPTGGVLTLATASAELPGTAASPPGRFVLLSVSDTGVGMDEETRARIFEPFFTTKPTGEGTGLGLATVYGIVQQSGGFIRVESESGRGTTFKIFLPRVDAPPEPAAPPSSSRPRLRGHETILVVEDQDSLREVIREALQLLGYRVLVAPHGEDALELARRHGGPLDLLITDIVMPRMGGGELASRLIAERPGLRVLYMSGHASETVTRHGPFEPRLLIEKPFSTEVLSLRVREALDDPRG
jgi:two-component system cell cycle sensor histidine kinase/response regulator CckA